MNQTRHNHFRVAGRYRRVLTGVAAAMTVFAALSSQASAAEQTRAYLYQKFQDGDIPTQQDFATLIDSALSFIDDRFALAGIAAAPDGGAAYFGEGVTVGSPMIFGQAAGLSDAWAGNSGFMALEFTQDSELHYGYFQLSSGQPGSSALYPMQFQYFVYEDQANTPLITVTVPEPSTLALLSIGAIGLLARAWRRTFAR